MRTTLILTLLAALAAPARGQAAEALVNTAGAGQSAAERAERAVEQAERERERALEQAERERERALAQAEQARERAAQQAERDRERAQRDRERAEEQAQRDRERAQQQAERDRERAQQQAQRAREQASQGSGETERTSRTVRVGSSGEIDVSNVSGNIVITRGSGSDAVIDVVKTARGRGNTSAKDVLQAVQVEITERGNRVEVRTRYPQGDGERRWRNLNVDVAINIAAPAGTRIRARSVSGSITSKDIQGEVAFETVSGSIDIANSGAVAAAKSISGSVEVIGAQGDGMLEASTASGSVVLRRVKARSLEVSSISGNITLEDTQSARAEAQTISGSLHLTGTLASGGRYELGSHSGSVEVALGGNTGFELEATSFSGSVHSDFPFKAGGNTGPGRGRSLRGVFGDGSAVLEITTFSGSITVRKR